MIRFRDQLKMYRLSQTPFSSLPVKRTFPHLLPAIFTVLFRDWYYYRIDSISTKLIQRKFMRNFQWVWRLPTQAKYASSYTPPCYPAPSWCVHGASCPPETSDDAKRGKFRMKILSKNSGSDISDGLSILWYYGHSFTRLVINNLRFTAPFGRRGFPNNRTFSLRGRDGSPMGIFDRAALLRLQHTNSF